MKPLVDRYPKICLCLLIFCSSIAKAQQTASTSSKVYYSNYYTGCWQTNDAAHGHFVTKADHTFQWVKFADKTAAVPDTLHGSWRIKSVFSIPKKMTVMVLKFSGGKKKQYEIGTTSHPAAIYLPNGVVFRKVPCK